MILLQNRINCNISCQWAEKKNLNSGKGLDVATQHHSNCLIYLSVPLSKPFNPLLNQFSNIIMGLLKLVKFALEVNFLSKLTSPIRIVAFQIDLIFNVYGKENFWHAGFVFKIPYLPVYKS